MSTNQSESLRDIARIASQRHDGAAGRTMERLLEGTRFSMVRTTFDKILAGSYTSRPSKKTLEALAYLAGVPQDRVFRAAGREAPKANFVELLPPDIDDLDDDQRRAVLSVARAFLNSNRAIEGMRNELQQLKDSSPGNVVNFPQADEEDPRSRQKSTPDFEKMAAYSDAGTEHAEREQEWRNRGEEPQ